MCAKMIAILDLVIFGTTLRFFCIHCTTHDQKHDPGNHRTDNQGQKQIDPRLFVGFQVSGQGFKELVECIKIIAIA